MKRTRPGRPESGAREPSKPAGAWFRISIWTLVAVLFLFSPFNLIILGWFTEAYRDTSAASEVSHRLHEVVFGVFFTLALVGAISQIVGAKRNTAGLIQLTVTTLSLALVVSFTVRPDPSLMIYLVPLAGVLIFGRWDRPIRSGGVHIWAVVLTLVTIPAFLDEAIGHFARATSGAQNHTTHWSVIGAFAIVLIALGIVVAIKVKGHRLVAWSLGSASVIYGIASLAFPYDASSHLPAYSIAMILWGLSWIVGESLHRSEPAPRKRSALRAIAVVMAIPVLALSAVIIPELDAPANVPHRPDPNRPAVMTSAVDRYTCLSCHASGIGGAPQPPHELRQSCGDDDHCWDGRSDCAGCHRVDPSLSGSDQEAERLAPLDAVQAWGALPAGGQPLSAGAIARLSVLGRSPNE